MAAFDKLDIEIRQIQPGDRLTGLKLGDAKFTPLKTFLQRHATTYEKQSLSRTYAAFNVAENGRIAGYVKRIQIDARRRHDLLPPLLFRRS